MVLELSYTSTSIAVAVPPPAPTWLDRLPLLLGWLGAIHAAIAALLLGRWLLGHIGLWRQLRRAEPVPWVGSGCGRGWRKLAWGKQKLS